MTAEAVLNLMYDGRGAIEPNLSRQCAIEEKIRERGPLKWLLLTALQGLVFAL